MLAPITTLAALTKGMLAVVSTETRSYSGRVVFASCSGVVLLTRSGEVMITSIEIVSIYA